MKITKFKNITTAVVFFIAVSSRAQEVTKKSVVDSIATREKAKSSINPKEENNRNVMLNADNNTGPRDVNIGLPATTVGITILENDLPVVFWPYPEASTSTWRQSVSLERTGLLKTEEVAANLGELGYAVNSYTQKGSKKFKLKAKLSGSNFGWLQGDLNISGPISKNGWTYSAGIFGNFDPNTYDAGFTDYADNTKIIRAGVTKYLKGDKGELNIFYKYAESYSFGNYGLFEYGENGKVRELNNFRIGRDSYLVRDGQINFKDIVTGENYWTSINGNKATSKSHNIDVFGIYNLNNGWKLKYSGRLHIAKASQLSTVPLSISDASGIPGYTIASTGQSYSGNVGTTLALNSPNIPTTSIMGRVTLSKTIDNHKFEVGLLERYYNAEKYKSNRSIFQHTVEAQPQRLLGPNSSTTGFYGYNTGGEYHNGSENKLSAFLKDDWKVSERFNLSYGVNFTYHTINGDYYLTPRTPNLVFDPSNKSEFEKKWGFIAGSLNASYNVTENFGVLADALYTEYTGKLGDFSGAVAPRLKRSRSPMAGLGLFWNNKYLQLVSKATYLTKDNYQTRYNLVNPLNTSNTETVTVYNGIQTVGWTTDVMLKPFKGFSLHYLITLQNPVYKDFEFTAFGNNYSYNDKNVLQVSKVLMEIDPSYTFGENSKFRLWASFRYFSKQFANQTNVLYFAPRWETFGGFNYTLNKNISFGLNVVNFLNQRGAKGTINGAELITDPQPYYGRLLTGSYIMPLTFQLSTSINF